MVTYIILCNRVRVQYTVIVTGNIERLYTFLAVHGKIHSYKEKG